MSQAVIEEFGVQGFSSRACIAILNPKPLNPKPKTLNSSFHFLFHSSNVTPRFCPMKEGRASCEQLVDKNCWVTCHVETLRVTSKNPLRCFV